MWWLVIMYYHVLHSLILKNVKEVLHTSARRFSWWEVERINNEWLIDLVILWNNFFLRITPGDLSHSLKKVINNLTKLNINVSGLFVLRKDINMFDKFNPAFLISVIQLLTSIGAIYWYFSHLLIFQRFGYLLYSTMHNAPIAEDFIIQPTLSICFIVLVF